MEKKFPPDNTTIDAVKIGTKTARYGNIKAVKIGTKYILPTKCSDKVAGKIGTIKKLPARYSPGKIGTKTNFPPDAAT